MIEPIVTELKRQLVILLQLTPNFKKYKINDVTYHGRKELKDASGNTGRKMNVELRLELACAAMRPFRRCTATKLASKVPAYPSPGIRGPVQGFHRLLAMQTCKPT
jgi:hypothetical protein